MSIPSLPGEWHRATGFRNARSAAVRRRVCHLWWTTTAFAAAAVLFSALPRMAGAGDSADPGVRVQSSADASAVVVGADAVAAPDGARFGADLAPVAAAPVAPSFGAVAPGLSNSAVDSVFTNIKPALDLLLLPTGQIFSDGFESGSVSAWSATVP